MNYIVVIFHVATLMPNKDTDPNCNAKKLHIGNDEVTIVYNDSGEDYRLSTIKVHVCIYTCEHKCIRCYDVPIIYLKSMSCC